MAGVANTGPDPTPPTERWYSDLRWPREVSHRPSYPRFPFHGFFYFWTFKRIVNWLHPHKPCPVWFGWAQYMWNSTIICCVLIQSLDKRHILKVPTLFIPWRTPKSDSSGCLRRNWRNHWLLSPPLFILQGGLELTSHTMSRTSGCWSISSKPGFHLSLGNSRICKDSMSLESPTLSTVSGVVGSPSMFLHEPNN